MVPPRDESRCQHLSATFTTCHTDGGSASWSASVLWSPIAAAPLGYASSSLSYDSNAPQPGSPPSYTSNPAAATWALNTLTASSAVSAETTATTGTRVFHLRVMMMASLHVMNALGTHLQVDGRPRGGGQTRGCTRSCPLWHGIPRGGCACPS